jgi:hypothetical protein
MPASRLPFALADLMSEIAIIAPDASGLATLTLDLDSYQAAHAEMVNHLGPAGMRESTHDGVRSFTFDGIQIVCGPEGA